MTTCAPSTTPYLNVHPSHRLNRIDRKIYAGFTEHMGRAIYGGIYDPTNPNTDLIDSSTGFRLDVLDALRPLEIPVIRYPGGNFTSTYHWQDGVGPRESRPRRPELAWHSIESNEFGTDEFMQWCTQLGAEPYFCLNFGTGTLDEALAWLEYCNGTLDTYYANLRRKNGHPEPYKVKYWALGNEMWGDWQLNQMTAEAYAERAFQWAKALKLLDPSIELVLCGKEGANIWDFTVLQRVVKNRGIDELGEERVHLIDMHAIHMYTASEDHYENVTAPLVAERLIETASAMIDAAHYENAISADQKRPKVCFDEWNVWDPSRAPGSQGAEENYTLSDALAVGVYLNVLVRKSKHLGMANFAQTVNVISPLMTSKEGITKQTTWWPYELFCKYMRGSLIPVHVGCEFYEGRTKPEWVRTVKETPFVDISATIDDEGYVGLCVINLHLEREYETEIGGVDGEVKVYTVTGHDVRVTNMGGEEKVGVQETTWDGRGKYSFGKHSLTMLSWKVA